MMNKQVLLRNSALFLSLAGVAIPSAAQALPSFAVQTDQPCSACHVGAFGPQLKPFGRDFKLYGYTATDGKKHSAPIALFVRNSFTHTEKNQAPGQNPEAVFGNSNNNNFELGEISAFYAGRVTEHSGAYVEGSYDGIGGQLHLDNSDVRYIHEGKVAGVDYVGGITANDAPTVSDLWNSTPIWGFPFDASGTATGPAASVLIDGALQAKSIGLGAYAMFNDWVYLEFDGYRGMTHNALNFTGNTPATGSDQYAGLMPYWRLALQHELVKDHYFELGTYGIRADVYPGDDHTTSASDRITDTALDANYQWLGGGNEHFISAHTTYIHEHQDLKASHISVPTDNASDNLNTFRADVSYSYENTYTPTIQYFDTWGTTDIGKWGTTNGSPNTQGVLFELAYVPFGKPESPALSWLAYGSRLNFQYTAYSKFDGTKTGASDHNTFYVNLSIALAPKW